MSVENKLKQFEVSKKKIKEYESNNFAHIYKLVTIRNAFAHITTYRQINSEGVLQFCEVKLDVLSSDGIIQKKNYHTELKKFVDLYKKADNFIQNVYCCIY